MLWMIGMMVVLKFDDQEENQPIIGKVSTVIKNLEGGTGTSAQWIAVMHDGKEYHVRGKDCRPASKADLAKEFEQSVQVEVESGSHLGEVRRWMQWNAHNGDTVTWGSHQMLSLRGIAVCEMETLAQRIANYAIAGVLSSDIRRCLETLLEWTDKNKPESDENTEWQLFRSRMEIRRLLDKLQAK